MHGRCKHSITRVSVEPEFQVVSLLEALTEGGVDYVVIGAVAARMHGSSVVTRDLDVCYARDQTNLEALAATLRGLGARLRGTDPDVPFRLDAKSLRAGDATAGAADRG